MYFVSFGVLTFCKSLSKKLIKEKRLKIQILRQWARAHMPTIALQANGLELSPVELERIEHSSHLCTRMCRRDIQADWARAHPAELAKTHNCTRTPIRPFLMPKAPVSLISTAGHTAFVFLVVSCKRGTLERGR